MQNEKCMEKKIEILEYIKSYRAILNNSFRVIQKINIADLSERYIQLYQLIVTIDKNQNIDIKKKFIDFDTLEHSNTSEEYTFKHSTVILSYKLKIDEMQTLLKALDIDKKLESFNNLSERYIEKNMYKALISVGVLFIILLILIILYLIYSHKLSNSIRELSKFRTTVEGSDNIVVITDENKTIKYVNEAFTKTTGYTAKEAIGQKPNILKDANESEAFYKELNETIYSGKKWSGEFKNIDKYGHMSYEKASIMPVLDDKGKIKEFIAIKLDVTTETLMRQQIEDSKKKIEHINKTLAQRVKEEVHKNREKDKQMVAQSRLAQMGEMLSMIAHQWRQPLAAISATSFLIELKAKQNRLDNAIAEEKAKEISNYAQHLSHTIDDFRDFFKPNKVLKTTSYDEVIGAVLGIIEVSISSKNIQLYQELNCHNTFNTYPNELHQVVLNLVKNAEDILLEQKVENPYIKIVTYEKDKRYILEVSDNGGGVPKDIIENIFDPYFSTKSEKNGTGLGLYMSKTIIEEHCGGKLSVRNSLEGAVFKILLEGIEH